MRLLQYSESGEFSIHSFDEGAIPSYVILSHTWGADEDEVTFADLVTGNYMTKIGYKKLLFCGKQARHDGLQYFWIDTCCIDKSNSAELAFSIRSMFGWYRNATRCYVYLSDVPGISGEAANSTAFRKSRWFTRGWTLQELVAPSEVDFFSQDGQRFGSKLSLLSALHEITRIPEAALQGKLLSDFTVNERILWNEHRETKVPTDHAYSLMGILGVSLSPLKGESLAEAMKRVVDEAEKQNKCIQDLRYTDPRHDKTRIEGIKGDLFADSYRWVLENTTFKQWHQDSTSRLLWIKGDPGKGKTMLLCGIIDELHRSMPRTLLSYFFCQATDPRINSATAVLRGLLYILVVQRPSLLTHVRKKYEYAGKSLFEDANAWIALTEIFVDVLQDPSLRTTYLVVDALDECISDSQKLLDFIAEQSSSASSHVKWIVSSRNWPGIGARLERAGQKTQLSLELNEESVTAAVTAFIQWKVGRLAQIKKYSIEVQHAVLHHLTSHAKGTFLWVALICRDLEATQRWNVPKKLTTFPPGLDSLYKRMLLQISESEDAEICRQVLASVAILYRPVTVLELTALVEQLNDLADDLESVREIISLCGSFLTLRNDTVYFVHQSAKDFLLTKGFHEIFPHGREAIHQAIFSRSVATLTRVLRRDMCQLKALGMSIEDVRVPLAPLAASHYACVHWIDHLYNSHPSFSADCVSGLQTARIIDEFLRKKYLYWLESLSLCKSVEYGITSMTKLWSLLQVNR